MLSDKDYRQRVIDNLSDPSVKAFWVDEFLKYNERYMQEAGDAIKNKIGQFTNNPLIRNIVGQPHSSFDIRQLMDERKIIIMNLSKGLIGEQNANLLGSMLTTRVYLAAMSRADLSRAELEAAPNFYFFVDEFQSFANATFANILSEARKYKLNLTIAHQYVDQMEEEVRSAVFGNVGTIIAFRVGPFDAEILESIFTPKFLAADLVNLGFAQIYLTLMIDGIGSPPFSAVTLPPIESAETSYKDVIIDHSRHRFARKRSEAEALITDFHKPINPDDDAVRAGRNSRNDDRDRGDKHSRTYSSRNSSDRPKPVSRPASELGKTKATETRSLSKPSSPVPKEDKSLDDLRAVLKNITTGDQKGNGTGKHSSTNSPKAASDHGLKDALARALGKEVASSDLEFPQAKLSQATKKTPKDDPLAPKKLARMMRVSENERPPL